MVKGGHAARRLGVGRVQFEGAAAVAFVQATTVSTTREGLTEHWVGASAESYLGYARQLKAALDDAGTQAGKIEQLLQQIDTDLDTAQNDLDSSYVRASGACSSAPRSGGSAVHLGRSGAGIAAPRSAAAGRTWLRASAAARTSRSSGCTA
ncbi:hypothetical protein [Serinicoccus sp. CNJ-927]|uniref:hypothetical protein n=1 Tax=Serinicoccus sp. CNJ-927 TaxID=1904970 RepID=UPI00117A3CCD|nr:hypothetical protein [Serinicoccus sp. CNJ-927]